MEGRPFRGVRYFNSHDHGSILVHPLFSFPSSISCVSEVRCSIVDCLNVSWPRARWRWRFKPEIKNWIRAQVVPNWASAELGHANAYTRWGHDKIDYSSNSATLGVTRVGSPNWPFNSLTHRCPLAFFGYLPATLTVHPGPCRTSFSRRDFNSVNSMLIDLWLSIMI